MVVSCIHKQEVLKLVYSIICNTCPDYFTNYINIEIDTRTTRNKVYAADIPSLKSDQYKSFQNQGRIHWTQIPDDIKNSKSLSSFKNKLKSHLLEQELSKVKPPSEQWLCTYSCIEAICNK